MDDRIRIVGSTNEARKLLEQEFADVSIEIRGIITSVSPTLVKYYKGIKIFDVKPLPELLNDGSELDVKDPNFFTRVCEFPGKKYNPFPWVYADPDQICELNLWGNREDYKFLRTALLVYDPRLLVSNEGFWRESMRCLPDNPKERAKAILKLYVINASCHGREISEI